MKATLGNKIRQTRYAVMCIQFNSKNEAVTKDLIHFHDSLEDAKKAVINEMAQDSNSKKVYGSYWQKRAYRIIQKNTDAAEDEEPVYWDFMEEE